MLNPANVVADGRLVALPVAASRGVKLGGTVATVGFPNIGLQGFAPKLAKGEIASLSGAGDDARYFQISVPVQPGNSGGALVDERGNVVGVVSAKLNASAALRSSGALPENVNYAVKSSYLLSFLESVPDVTPNSNNRRPRSGSLRMWSKKLNKLRCWCWFTDFLNHETHELHENKNGKIPDQFFLCPFRVFSVFRG
ncbi:MAG: trypsin-like peptidase domain-containing protein [Verrucomicrobia bacterium]|nr:trypsin-like peptidase domain-containing protein [Verrucomicrobiota bacterium]